MKSIRIREDANGIRCELIEDKPFSDPIVEKVKIAKCSPEDTYDFETGALIALMKMCGVDKVKKATKETFFDVAENAVNEYEEEIHGLKEEIKRLKGESEKRWKIYQRNVQKKQDRINELNNIEEGYIKLREEYDSLFEEKEKLQHEYNLCLNSENALKCTVDLLNKSVDKLSHSIDGYKNDLYKVAKRCKELERAYKASNDDEAKLVEYYQREIKKLEAENEKLKLDCEKLQHGYNDMIFCGSRQNGKQYTFLVDLFKKTDQKKVDAAYKEAYNTELPVWQKEFLKQMCDFHKKSKEKTELPRTLDINGTVYRKSIQIKDFGEQINKLTVDSLIEQSRAFTRKCVDEWLYKVPTKREEMWENILGASKCPPVDIKVAKQDITTFLRELQDKIPEVMWNGSDCPLTDYTNPYWFKHDYIYFALFRYDDTGKLKLCYSEEHHSWIKTTLDYLPPIRWDLFKKGRLAVKVNHDNYKEFYEACEKELGRRPVTAVFTEDFTVSICKKDGLFEIFTIEDQKKTGKKIVDWEDVR